MDEDWIFDYKEIDVLMEALKIIQQHNLDHFTLDEIVDNMEEM